MQKFLRGGERIIKGFKDEIFQLNYDDAFEEEASFEEEEEKTSETKVVSLIIKSLSD